MSSLPMVSVIIPMRNEERYVAICLESILANDYPHDRLEIFCVNGCSEDDTPVIVQRYSAQDLCVRLLQNPKKIFAAAVNIGIMAAKGEVIMIMGAHTSYAKDYISTCVNALSESGADNVGGMLKVLPGKDALIAKAIALTLSHPFGAGNAHYKTGSTAPMWVDTVFGGCYKAVIFDSIGLFNENLARSSDMDLNARLKRAGGRTLLVPDIVASYYAKETLLATWKHNFEDGVWAIYPLKFGCRIFFWRHLVSLAFVSSVIGTAALSILSSIFMWVLLTIVGLYLVACSLSSIHIALREKDSRLVFLLPLAFSARHIGYGLGSLYGVGMLLGSKVSWRSEQGS